MNAKDTELCRGREVRMNADNQCNELTLHFKSEWVDSPHKHKPDYNMYTHMHTLTHQTNRWPVYKADLQLRAKVTFLMLISKFARKAKSVRVSKRTNKENR